MRAAAVPRWPGHVDVRPLDVLGHETGQVQACEEHAAGPCVVRVADISDGGRQFFFLLLQKRHGPRVLAHVAARLRDEIAELVGAHHAGGALAQSDELRPGERGRFDEVGRRILAGTRDGVGKHEAPLRVGVDDFTSDAAVMGDHVARAGGGARWHVLGQGQPGVDTHRQLEAGCCGNDGQLRSGAAHV